MILFLRLLGTCACSLCTRTTLTSFLWPPASYSCCVSIYYSLLVLLLIIRDSHPSCRSQASSRSRTTRPLLPCLLRFQYVYGLVCSYRLREETWKQKHVLFLFFLKFRVLFLFHVNAVAESLPLLCDEYVISHGMAGLSVSGAFSS